MEIKSLGICRASQKIYEKLRVEGLLEGDDLKVVYDKELADAPIPCELYDLGNREYVAVTPDLAIPQASYVLGAVDAIGKVSQAVCHTVNFKNAKWQSRVNYRLRKDLYAQIRCYDEAHRLSMPESELSVDKVTSCPTCMKFRLKLSFPGAELGTPRVVLLRDDSMELIANELTPMGSRALPPEGPGAGTDHEANVTVNVPWGAEDMIAYVWEEERPGMLLQQRLLKSDWEPMRLALDNLLFNNAGVDPYYNEWFHIHRADERKLFFQKQVVFEKSPKFSIIVPLYRTPVDLFEDMIASVEAQSYAEWECVLVNSTPDAADLKEHVDAAAKRDTRIKVVELAENLGISLNTNAGIEAATGDYICFFDHDDVLEPNILFEYARAVNNDPAVDMLYCDEDKLMPDGRFAECSFKPDFNLDLLHTSNYICHMLCIRKSLLDQIEPSRREHDGAQDHNLTLRVAEKTQHIHHVPKVLYHWRVTEGSTAGPAEAKAYATNAGVLAVQSHLDRCGIKAKAEPTNIPFTYHVSYAVPEPTPLVSIIIPTCDHIDLLRVCLDSIADKTTYPNYEVVVVENNSRKKETFDYYETLTSNPRVSVTTWKGSGFNFSELINFGRKAAKGDYLLLLNNDTEVITSDWIERMVGNAARSEVGCVGAKLYYPDDTIQHAGVVFAEDAGHSFQGLPRENPGYFRFASKQRDVTAVTGACLMVSAELFDAVNGFDTALAVAYNDVDFCLKMLKINKLNVYLPDVELYHYESVSRGLDEDEAGHIRFVIERETIRKRWAEEFGFRDRNYNPNLIARLPEACFYHF